MTVAAERARRSLVFALAVKAGGKSELGRARWLVTPTRRKPRESATEKTPPKSGNVKTAKRQEVKREHAKVATSTLHNALAAAPLFVLTFRCFDVLMFPDR